MRPVIKSSQQSNCAIVSDLPIAAVLLDELGQPIAKSKLCDERLAMQLSQQVKAYCELVPTERQHEPSTLIVGGLQFHSFYLEHNHRLVLASGDSNTQQNARSLLEHQALVDHLSRCLIEDSTASTLVMIKVPALNESTTTPDASRSLQQKMLIDRIDRELPPSSALGKAGDNCYVTALGSTQDQVQACCERLRSVLSNPLIIEGSLYGIKPTIAIVQDCEADSAEDWLSKAAFTVSQAQSDGKALANYDKQAFQKQIQQQQLELDMRKGLLLDQFSVLYQPKVDLRTDQICGFEALVRWNHPTLGLLSPDLFIPIAEKNGLIVELGKRVLEISCMAALQWPEDISVAVNLSPRQIELDTFQTTVAHVLASTGLPARQLELEVTESLPLRDNPEACETLTEIALSGVNISLDDFGTGFASLSHLQLFNFNKLKIDQSFIRPAKDSAQNDTIVESIIKLGASLEMDVVAEGVETNNKLTQLRQQGCPIVQGYLISKPVAFPDTAELLKTWNNVTPTPVQQALPLETTIRSEQKTSDIYQLVYVSDCLIDTSTHDGQESIKRLQQTAISRNNAIGITGALMFNNDMFAQILEGSLQNLESAFERIQSDPRHANVCVVDLSAIECRKFEEWSMAFLTETVENKQDFIHLANAVQFSDEHLKGNALYSIISDLFNRTHRHSRAA